MTHSHTVRFERLGRTGEKGITDPAARVLEREPLLLRMCSDVERLDDDGQAQPGPELAAERLVAGRGLTKLVIEVRQSGHGEAAMLREIAEDQGQSDRIRPP